MIELGKKYQARDGREVRIYAVDAGGDTPVHGAIRDLETWEFCSWTQDGHYWVSRQESSGDLIEVKPERTGWINIYDERTIGFYPTKYLADISAAKDRIACIQITFTEGQGL